LHAVKIGVMGGTFDPVHLAHLAVAEQARTQLDLDQVLFIPAWLAPHKPGNTRAAARAAHRLAMLRLAVQDNPHFAVDEFELQRQTTSYTVETLRNLRTRVPAGTELFLLIGADNYLIFHQWCEPEQILAMATPVVYPRPGFAISAPDPRFRLLAGPAFALHATWIRATVQHGGSIRYVVPEPVRAYIAAHHLYTTPEE
jgi:nicotinate-nucleotide adenylyltransferase